LTFKTSFVFTYFCTDMKPNAYTIKHLLAFLLCLSMAPLAICQDVESEEVETKVLDSLYKEDQFYIGVTYNLLAYKPKGVSQNGFSSGFHFGFTKDMPINKRRNMAIGLGLGLSFNSFNHNLLIEKKEDNTIEFNVLNDAETAFTKNKFSMHLVEVPLEFRWRTSTAEDYMFWRIYTGFKFGYVFSNGSKFRGDPRNIKLNNIDAFNKFQYGINLSVGYNTWNFYAYYALNPIFKSDSKINATTIDAKALKIGLMFYIL